MKDPIIHTFPSALKIVQQTCSRRCGNSSPRYLVAPPVTSLTGTHSALHLALHTKRWQGGELYSGGHEAAWAVPHLLGVRSTEVSKLTFLCARPSRLPSILEMSFSMLPVVLEIFVNLFLAETKASDITEYYWHCTRTPISFRYSHSVQTRPNPIQVLVAVRFYLTAHPSHKSPCAKILPFTSFGYSAHSLQFLTTPQVSNCPWLYLYFSGNAAVCIFQSGCCCHSSPSGHCQKLQVMDSPKTSEEAKQPFFRLSSPI